MIHYNVLKGEKEIHTGGARRLLFLTVFGLSLISYSSMTTNQASALFGTGIGINKVGPVNAQIGATIAYSISVINLGDYWIRNITVTDRFPNGTISVWSIPDLAPLLQVGHQYAVFGILYTLREEDVLPEQPRHIVNHAEVAGYADVGGLSAPVAAQTDFPTFIGKPPVACFTLSDERAQINQAVTFDASCSYDSDGQIVKFEWDWEGDGTYDFDAGANPFASHSYAREGVYYPRLRVTDNDGLTNETTRSIYIMSLFPVGGYSISLHRAETSYPQATYLVYVILLVAVTTTSRYLHLVKPHRKKQNK